MINLFSLISTSLISAVLTWVTIKIYRHFNWLEQPAAEQHPKQKKFKSTHSQAVPRGGGIPIFFSVLISSLIFLQIDKYLIALLVGSLILTVTGVLDDILNIHPYIRIFTGVLAGLIIVGSGIGIAYLTNPFGPGVIHFNTPQLAFEIGGQLHTIWILADIFALFFILWNMNIVNWSKGVDGQLPAFVIPAFIIIALLHNSFSADPTEFNNTILAFIMAGSYIGLLIFNWYPQKIMPGYGGSTLAGFFLSVLAIISGAKVATTLMVLAIPTADAIFTIFRRLAKGQSPIWGDREHLHHQLLDQLGWGRQRISLFYAATTIILGMLSFYLTTTGKMIMLILSFIFVFGIQIWALLNKKNKIINQQKNV